jgi:3-(3-hydroxy-phenyl)propionate hydroxylase
MRASKTKVVISGAGPVGSVAAYFLARQGINVILLETNSGCAMDLRASTFHPPTLEMLAEIGIAQPLIEKGLKAPHYHFRERQTGEIIDFDLSEISDVTQFPYRVQCEQYHLSKMLTEALSTEPYADVRFNNRVVGFDQNMAGVDVFVETPLDIEKIEADYLIAADGANSIIRKWLETEFIGFTYPEKFLCFTTDEPLEAHLPHLCHVNYVSDPNEWLVLLRTPSLWRVLVPADGDTSDSDLVSDAKKNDVFSRLINSKTPVTTAHRTIYRVHQRVAKQFLHGRAILIGDAAHLNNPLGGFGMNSGIHDAINLCQKLTHIYKNGGDADLLLGLFERQRQTTTHDFIQQQTQKNMAYMKGGQSAQHSRRKAEMRDVHDSPVKRRDFLLRQSMFQCLEDEKAIQ